MNPTFPSRTAGETTLPSGIVVFVKTLNSLQREEVNREANFYAAMESRRWRKGTEGHSILVEDLGRLSVDEQADFVAGQEELRGVFYLEAWEKYPEPIRPERVEDQSDSQYVAACEKYEEEIKAVQQKREDFMTKQRAAKVVQAKGWTAAYRLNKCVEGYLERNFNVEFAKRSQLEKMYRAVRNPEKKMERFFPDIETVADLDDDDRMHLIEFYDQLDSVRTTEIPT